MSGDCFRGILKSMGLECEIREFPESTKTSQQAADLLGIDISGIAKTISFFCGEEPVLVVACGNNRVSGERLSSLTGKKARIMSREEVLETTGYPAGAVPPFGHPEKLRVFIDRDIFLKKDVWAAAGTANSVFRIAPPELLEHSGGEPADIKE